MTLIAQGFIAIIDMYPLRKLISITPILATFCLGLSAIPAQTPPKPKDTTINSGDTIQVSLKEDPQFSFRGIVEDSGDISLPYLGSARVAGLTTAEIEASIETELLADYYQTATLNVSLVKQASGQVYVYGAVSEPGVITLPPSGQYSIPQILAAVNGLTTWSDPERAYVIQQTATGDQIRTDVNIRAQILAPDPEDNIYLKNGDELYVPGQNQTDSSELLSSAPREVIIVGQINNPGIQTFAPGEDATLMRAIFKAGGLTKFAQDTKVKLIRYQGNHRTVEILNAEEIIVEGFLDKDVTLYSGDMIIVPQKLVNF